MKQENQRCPNCDKLINTDEHVSIGGVNYCDTKCFEESMCKEETEHEPLLR